MKVGDYVRTKEGYIAKIEEEFDESYLCDDTVKYIYEPSPFIPKDKLNEMIIKSSPNIIDLIGVGDLIYVDISPDNSGGIIVPRIAETENELNLFKQLLENGWIIKSIITREQLGSIKYKVGE